MLEDRSVAKRGRRGFSCILLFNIPQGLCLHHVSYPATQLFLFKAISETSVMSWPLHRNWWRKAGKLGRGVLAGKSSVVVSVSRGESQSRQQRPWRYGDSTAMGALHLFLAQCLLRAMQALLPSPQKSIPAQQRQDLWEPWNLRRDGTVVVAVQGDWLSAWRFVRGR